MKHAIIDQGNKVVNIVEWDCESEYCPCENHTMVEALDDTMIGASYLDGVFVNPPSLTPPNQIVLQPSSAKILADALVSKGVLTQAEIDTVASENGVTFLQN